MNVFYLNKCVAEFLNPVIVFSEALHVRDVKLGRFLGWHEWIPSLLSSFIFLACIDQFYKTLHTSAAALKWTYFSVFSTICLMAIQSPVLIYWLINK